MRVQLDSPFFLVAAGAMSTNSYCSHPASGSYLCVFISVPATRTGGRGARRSARPVLPRRRILPVKLLNIIPTGRAGACLVHGHGRLSWFPDCPCVAVSGVVQVVPLAFYFPALLSLLVVTLVGVTLLFCPFCFGLVGCFSRTGGDCTPSGTIISAGMSTGVSPCFRRSVGFLICTRLAPPFSRLRARTCARACVCVWVGVCVVVGPG